MYRRLILASLAAFVASSMAMVYAQSSLPLPPYLTGTNTQNQRLIMDMGMARLGRNSGLTANAGGGQANGTPLNLGINRFSTVATAGDSATLPTYSGGLVIMVVNATATSMNIFPNSGGTINALSANAAYALAAGKSVIFFQAVDGNWYANLSA